MSQAHCLASTPYTTGARRYPLSYTLSGSFVWPDMGTLLYQGIFGYAWSSTPVNDGATYNFYVDNRTIAPQHNVDGRGLGIPLLVFLTYFDIM